MMRKILFLLMAAALFTACEKDKEDVVGLEVTLANMAGTYKVTAATMSSGGATIDVFNNNMFFPACGRDDLYVLTTTGGYTRTDAGVQCSPTTNKTGTFTVNTTAKTATIDGEAYNIASLTATQIVATTANFQGTGAAGSITFTRQ